MQMRNGKSSRSNSSRNDQRHKATGSSLLLAISVLSGFLILAPVNIRIETTVLSIFGVFVLSTALADIYNVFEALREEDSPVIGDKYNEGSETALSNSHKAVLTLVRDMAFNLTIFSLGFSFFLESSSFSGASKMILSLHTASWRERLFLVEAESLLIAVVLEIIKTTCLLMTVSESLGEQQTLTRSTSYIDQNPSSPASFC
jgi:hypothetical protein